MILDGIELRKVSPLLQCSVISQMVKSTELVLREVDSAAEEIVDFAAELIRIPTVNPPGEFYPDCAQAIGARLQAFDFDVDYLARRVVRNTRKPIRGSTCLAAVPDGLQDHCCI